MRRCSMCQYSRSSWQRPSSAKRSTRQPGSVISFSPSRIVVHHSTATFEPASIGSPILTWVSRCDEVTVLQYSRIPAEPTLGGRKGDER